MNKLIGETYMKYPTAKSKKRVRFGIYECNYCDNTFEAQTYQVKIGHSTSCGCKVGFQKGNIPANKSKYNTNSNLYHKWESMKYRVKFNEYYIAKQVSICKSWLDDFGNFEAWALANNYAKGLHLHRVNDDGNYEPNNCVFISASEHIRIHNIDRDSYKHLNI